MINDQDRLDALLLEQASKSHETLVSHIQGLDSKAASLIDFGAVLTGLIVVAGVLSVREVWDPQRLAIEWLYTLAGLLAVAAASSFTAMLFGLFGWWRFRIFSINSRELVEKYQDGTFDELRAALIVEFSDQASEMFEHQRGTRKWVKRGLVTLGVSIVTLLGYAILLLIVSVS